MLQRIRNVYKKFCTIALIPVGIAILIQMFYVFINVFGRFILNAPVAGAMEASGEMMIYIVYLSIAYILIVDGHVRIDFIFPHLGSRTKHIFDLVALLIGIIFMATIVWYTTPVFLHSLQIGESSPGAVEFPLYPQRFVVILGSLMLLIQLVLDLCQAVLDLKHNVKPVVVTEVTKIVENY